MSDYLGDWGEHEKRKSTSGKVTRDDIRKLGQKHPMVNMVLQYLHRGDFESWEEAMRYAVKGLVEHNNALTDTLAREYTYDLARGSIPVTSTPADASDDDDEPRIVCDVCGRSVVQDEHFACLTCEVKMCLNCWQSESCPEHGGALAAPVVDALASDEEAG